MNTQLQFNFDNDEVSENDNNLYGWCIQNNRHDLIDTWSIEENKTKLNITMLDVKHGTTKKVFWICNKHGIYEASVAHRVQGTGCPFCAGKKILKGFNDLATTNPEVAKEWNYEKNSFGPDEITAGSIKKVWWKCSLGHEWEINVNNRTGKHSNGCPYCGNKKILVGFNDLATTEPEIAKQWNYEKNEIKPSEVVRMSQKRVWWKCVKGHNYQAVVGSKVLYNTGCPVCANTQLEPGYNDLATLYPEIAAEWNYEKNDITPRDIMGRSRKRVWWKCSFGHEWETALYVRTVMSCGCPICAGEKPEIGVNDLLTKAPEIAAEWNYEKNHKSPEEYMSYSNKKVWWTCSKCGSDYQALISGRFQGSGCPVCANKKIVTGINDIFTIKPELEKEWDYEKNTIDPKTISYGTDKKAWWRCWQGHSWKATISSRSAGRGCPICASGIQSSVPEKIIAFYLSKHFDLKTNFKALWLDKRELDIYIPSLNIAIEYDGDRWHQNIEKDLVKDSLCESKGIILIRIREANCPSYESNAIKICCAYEDNSMKYMNDIVMKIFEYINTTKNFSLTPDINVTRDYTKIIKDIQFDKVEDSIKDLPVAKEWNYEKNGLLKPEFFKIQSQKKVWWKCEKGHEWQAIIASRTKSNHPTGCPYCSNKKIIIGFNDLATLYPEVAAEWNYEKNDITPQECTYGNSKKIWWKCSKGHEWKTSVYVRTTMKCGCPYCSGVKALSGENDLSTLYPNIAKEWNYEKNGSLLPNEIKPGIDTKVWWKCSKGHEWQTSPYNRSHNRSNCPVCGNKKLLIGYNDLATKYPDIAKEWNYEKNDVPPSEVLCGSHHKVWWKCSTCGNEWQTLVSTRTIQHCGCPKCAVNKRKK